MKEDDSIFPHKEIATDNIGFFVIPASAGMGARDYIAIQAMQGLLAGDTDCLLEPSEVARFAYEQADLMIAQSQKGGE